MSTVSVLMTYYNGERYLKEQLASIAHQTTAANEIVIMDDHSSPEALEYLKGAVAEAGIASKTRIISNEKNLGYADNFHKGMLEAQSDIVFLCDQDDIWLDTKIRDMLETLNNNRGIDLLCCDIEPFSCVAGAPKWDKRNLTEMLDDGSLEMCNDEKKNFHLRRSGCTMAFRKSFFNDINAFWTENWAHDDFLWKMSVFKGSCAILHKVLHRRRLHLNNTSEIKVRTREWRQRELQQSIRQDERLLQYVANEKEKAGIVQRDMLALNKRLAYLQSGNPFQWLVLATRYRDAYPRSWKGLLMDAYLVTFNQYERRGNQ